MKIDIPIYRAKRIDSGEYVIGHLIPLWGEYFISYGSVFGVPFRVKIDITTLAIKMPEREFFMSIDVENGKGGDKISEHQSLAWNGSMMNCSILVFNSSGEREDYIIDLDNMDFDNFNAIGIQK